MGLCSAEVFVEVAVSALSLELALETVVSLRVFLCPLHQEVVAEDDVRGFAVRKLSGGGVSWDLFKPTIDPKFHLHFCESNRPSSP